MDQDLAVRGTWLLFVTGHPFFTSGGLDIDLVFFGVFYIFSPKTAEMTADNGG